MDLKKLEEEYKIGQEIFEQLFKLNDADLKEKLIDITEDNHKEILTNACDCVRTITNEISNKIRFSYYDSLEINWSGITIHPEHGMAYNIVKFNKYFKI